MREVVDLLDVFDGRLSYTDIINIEYPILQDLSKVKQQKIETKNQQKTGK